MTFREMLKAKDEAIVEDEKAETVVVQTKAAYEAAVAEKATKSQAVKDAHQAIHDHLAEFGAHNLYDKDGTCTVYTAVEDGHGWRTHHPISGDADIAGHKKAAG